MGADLFVGAKSAPSNNSPSERPAALFRLRARVTGSRPVYALTFPAPAAAAAVAIRPGTLNPLDESGHCLEQQQPHLMCILRRSEITKIGIRSSQSAQILQRHARFSLVNTLLLAQEPPREREPGSLSIASTTGVCGNTLVRRTDTKEW